MCLQDGFGDFCTFYELESSSRWSIRSGMREARKRDFEGKHCCCCLQFLRPSGGGKPLQKRQNAFLDSHPFRKGKEPNKKKEGRRVIPPAHSQFRQCTSPPKQRAVIVIWPPPSLWSQCRHCGAAAIVVEPSPLLWSCRRCRRCGLATTITMEPLPLSEPPTFVVGLPPSLSLTRRCHRC